MFEVGDASYVDTRDCRAFNLKPTFAAGRLENKVGLDTRVSPTLTRTSSSAQYSKAFSKFSCFHLKRTVSAFKADGTSTTTLKKHKICTHFGGSTTGLERTRELPFDDYVAFKETQDGTTQGYVPYN